MVNTKEQAKEEVRKLVENYKKLVENGEIHKFNEQLTKHDFIEPLFEAMNWNTRDHNEVTMEEKVSKKRADYGFRINDIPKFFLEAKGIEEKLDNEDAEQAINYSWLKDVTWAVLTNFIELKVFNAKWKSKSTIDKRFFEIRCEEFVDRFDDLWMISKDAFINKDLDEKAIKYGKETKRTPVTPVIEQIFNDLMTWRDKLRNDIVKWDNNKNIYKNEEILDECVQRIIDRLIFIRVCEDRELEPPTLKAGLNEWKSNKKGQTFMQVLTGIFRDFDIYYDGTLFSEHISEGLVVGDGVINDIIYGLYQSSDSLFSYDFSAIAADVLGNIYEEYLGYVLKKGKGKVAAIHQHRKQMGIYYTPNFVVDYIVKNTVGKLLNQNKSSEIANIKILDPACGSGSFLITAFDYLMNYHKAHSEQNLLSFLRKTKILTDNIYGVDLDPKAVEIAQLNLLLRAVEKRQRLPMLQNNIKNGNSLINIPTKSKENNFEKAFDWKEEFQDVMKSDKFDVIIGNPPYVFGGGEGISTTEKNYFKEHYISGSNKINLFTLFIEKAIELTKEGGLISFIVPNTLLRVTSYSKLRKHILDNCRILKIVDLSVGVFKGVTASTIVIILQKESNGDFDDHNIIIQSSIDGSPTSIKQSSFKNDEYVFNIFSDTKKDSILEKMQVGTIPLGELSEEMIFGVVITKNIAEVVSDKKIDERYKKFLEGRDIGRYFIKHNNKYLLYEKKLLHRARTKQIFETPEKLLVQRISGGKRPLIVAYDNEQYYDKESINNIILKDDSFDIKYIMAIMNSALMNWFYSVKFTNGSKLTVNISKTYLSLLPIKKISSLKQKTFTEMVDKIVSLNGELETIGRLSDRGKRLQEDIKKIDGEIDQNVYELYGLTPEERRIVENS